MILASPLLKYAVISRQPLSVCAAAAGGGRVYEPGRDLIMERAPATTAISKRSRDTGEYPSTFHASRLPGPLEPCPLLHRTRI